MLVGKARIVVADGICQEDRELGVILFRRPDHNQTNGSALTPPSESSDVGEISPLPAGVDHERVDLVRREVLPIDK